MKNQGSLTAAKSVLAQDAELNAMSYDGIAGVLPEWIPPIFQRVFGDIRGRLNQHGIPHAKILEYIDAYPERLEEQFKGVTPIPGDVLDQISMLHWIREAVYAGADEGLRVLLGDEPAKGVNCNLQRNKSLASGRTLGTAKRQETAKENNAKLDKAIRDLFSKPESPGWVWTNEKISEYLSQPKWGLGYKGGTILNRVKKIAAEERKKRKNSLSGL